MHLHWLTHIWCCEQRRGYQGPSQLRTQQGWFLLIDPQRELGLHHVVHRCLSCICIPQPFLINHVFCGLYVLHTHFDVTLMWAAITKQLHAAKYILSMSSLRPSSQNMNESSPLFLSFYTQHYSFFSSLDFTSLSKNFSSFPFIT